MRRPAFHHFHHGPVPLVFDLQAMSPPEPGQRTEREP